jgi:CRP/FNR family transcriptional regulator, polysaccharide utilization system transcription regulator
MMNSPNIVKVSCSIGTTKIECLELLLPEELDFLNSKMVDVHYKKGEVIYKQGAFASNVMIVREGLIKTYIEGGADDKLVLQIFSPVNIIGLTALSEANNIWHHSAQAYIDTDVSFIDINALRQIMSKNAEFSAKVVSILTEQMIIMSGRFYCLTKKQTYGRLADVLLCLSNRIYKTQRFPLQLSRKDFAELSGMTIESIARIFTKFKADGLIKIDCGFLEIMDPVKLGIISHKG